MQMIGGYWQQRSMEFDGMGGGSVVEGLNGRGARSRAGVLLYGGRLVGEVRKKTARAVSGIYVRAVCAFFGCQQQPKAGLVF